MRGLLFKVRSAADIETLIVHGRPPGPDTDDLCAVWCPEPEDLRDLSQNQDVHISVSIMPLPSADKIPLVTAASLSPPHHIVPAVSGCPKRGLEWY